MLSKTNSCAGHRLAAGFALALAALGFLICAAVDPAIAQQRRGSGTARLTLTRTSDALYLGVPAVVKVNGSEVASLWRGESTTVTISAGASKITVDATLHPGVWAVALNARPGGHYTIEISPRGDSLAPGVLFGLAGTVVDAVANVNKAGAFKMRRVK
jgi:hypothetical protein